MKLLRLLRAGRSFVASTDMSRYQMGDPRSMPVFEAKSQSPDGSKVQSPAESKVQSPKSKVSATARSGWFGRLIENVGRLFSKRDKQGIPQFTKPTVQGELSLDRVKVVRNDLSDTDIEVVPAKLAADGKKESSIANRQSPIANNQSSIAKCESPKGIDRSPLAKILSPTPLTLALSPSEGERAFSNSKLQVPSSKGEASEVLEQERDAIEVGGS